VDSDSTSNGEKSLLACFCKNQYSKFASALEAVNFKDSDGKTVRLCDDWLFSQVSVFSGGLLTSFVIVCSNKLLQTVNESMIQWLHLETKSIEMNLIMLCVFLSYFVNTGFIIMLSWASFKDFGMFESGDGFTDFSSKWFDACGYLLV